MYILYIHYDTYEIIHTEHDISNGNKENNNITQSEFTRKCYRHTYTHTYIHTYIHTYTCIHVNDGNGKHKMIQHKVVGKCYVYTHVHTHMHGMNGCSSKHNLSQRAFMRECYIHAYIHIHTHRHACMVGILTNMKQIDFMHKFFLYASCMYKYCAYKDRDSSQLKEKRRQA